MKHTLLLSLLLLSACGEELTKDPVPAPTQTGASLTEDQINHYKSLCMDGNTALIGTKKTSCIQSFAPQSDNGWCEAEEQRRLSELQRAWDQVEAQAKANYDECLTDWRVSTERCLAIYEQDITEQISIFCNSAAI